MKSTTETRRLADVLKKFALATLQAEILVFCWCTLSKVSKRLEDSGQTFSPKTFRCNGLLL